MSTHTVARIVAAVYETLSPILNEMKEDIGSVKNAVASVNETVNRLAEEPKHCNNETASSVNAVNSELAGLESSLQSLIDNPPTEAVSTAVLVTLLPYMNSMEDDIKTELGQLVNERSTAVNETVVVLNNSMSDGLNCVKTELSSVNGIISDLGGHLQSHSQEIRSAVAQLHTGLSSLNESMRHGELSCTKLIGLKCGGTWGWRRAVYLDMTDPHTNCPSGWNLTGYSKRTCGRNSTGRFTCDSVFFPVTGGPYTQVCGRIRAYQYGITSGFYGQSTIDNAYFSGVAVMHGSPRQHIWTFVNGGYENIGVNNVYPCPCDTSRQILIPPYVGEDYFCESG